jgi:hypothetical protein
MDLKNEIKLVLNELGQDHHEPIKDSILIHLERAEHFYRLAEELNDSQYYNDVVYRTNQAYEGVLNYAYITFSGDYDEEGNCNLTTNEIEKYFMEEQVFNQRLGVAFALYRKKWRNESAHDSWIAFSKDEAFLAIVYVSAFICILLNQCVERISYDKIKIMKVLEDAGLLPKQDEFVGIEAIISKLKFFHTLPLDKIIKGNNVSQITGAIKGYLEKEIIGIEAVTHYKGEDVIGYQPEIVLNYMDETILFIEVKIDYTKHKQEYGYKQIKDTLFRSDVKHGVIYFYTHQKDAEYEVDRKILRDKEIITLKPKKK